VPLPRKLNRALLQTPGRLHDSVRAAGAPHGIAGSGMSALARILFDRGVPVSGCEARESITVPGCERSAAATSSSAPLPSEPRCHGQIPAPSQLRETLTGNGHC
jgi:Mur ligase-like protein